MFTECVSNQYTYFNMLTCWHARCDYKLQKEGFNYFFFEIFNVWFIISLSNFHKLKILIWTCHLSVCNCILWKCVEIKGKPILAFKIMSVLVFFFDSTTKSAKSISYPAKQTFDSHFLTQIVCPRGHHQNINYIKIWITFQPKAQFLILKLKFDLIVR